MVGGRGAFLEKQLSCMKFYVKKHGKHIKGMKNNGMFEGSAKMGRYFIVWEA